MLRRFFSDARGTAAIELALTAPMIAMAAVGAFDIVNGFALKLDMEQAAQRTTELALVLKPQGAESEDKQYLIDEVDASVDNPEDVTPDVDIFLTCNGERQDDFNESCAAGEAYARYVSVTVTSPYNTVFDYNAIASVIGLRAAFPSQITVTGSSTVRIQ